MNETEIGEEDGHAKEEEGTRSRKVLFSFWNNEYEIIVGPSNGTEQNRGTEKGIVNAIETGTGARTVGQDQERGRETGLNPKRNPPQRSVL